MRNLRSQEGSAGVDNAQHLGLPLLLPTAVCRPALQSRAGRHTAILEGGVTPGCVRCATLHPGLGAVAPCGLPPPDQPTGGVRNTAPRHAASRVPATRDRPHCTPYPGGADSGSVSQTPSPARSTPKTSSPASVVIAQIFDESIDKLLQSCYTRIRLLAPSWVPAERPVRAPALPGARSASAPSESSLPGTVSPL